jgi:hypothetical protein
MDKVALRDLSPPAFHLISVASLNLTTLNLHQDGQSSSNTMKSTIVNRRFKERKTHTKPTKTQKPSTEDKLGKVLPSPQLMKVVMEEVRRFSPGGMVTAQLHFTSCSGVFLLLQSIVSVRALSNADFDLCFSAKICVPKRLWSCSTGGFRLWRRRLPAECHSSATK